MPAGRPRKPTALKILEGRRGHHPLPPNEPKPDLCAPKCPEHLTGLAKETFEVLAARLDELGLVGQVDVWMLEGVCVAYAEAVGAGRAIEEYGSVMELQRFDKSGKYLSSYFQQRPEVSIRDKAWQRFHKLGTEFGLSAASRTKLAVGDTGITIDPIEEKLA